MTDSKDTKAAKPKTVADDMDSRRVFPNIEEASAYLGAMAESLTDFTKIPWAFAGYNVNEESGEGEFDDSIYTPETAVMVSTLRKVKGGVKAIVVAPIPTVEQLLANEAGSAWIDKILHKEMNHVAVRALRDAEDVTTMVDQMPVNMDGYINSSREGGSGIMETFNALFKRLNTVLSAGVPIWAKARLVKSDFKRCLESRGYALEFYPALEDRGEGKPSLFETALTMGITAAKKEGLDPTIFERWQATRNNKTFDAADEDDFDVDSLTEALFESEDDADGNGEADTAEDSTESADSTSS
jgi:hypothetical protein